MRVTRSWPALLALALGSCASGPDESVAPRAQHDLCALFVERPGWQEAAERSAKKWGAPVELVMAIMWRESAFMSQARPPKRYALGIIPAGHESSAYGFAQAIDGTWDWYRRETGSRGADRDDFAAAADFVGWYHAKTVATNGISPHDAYAHYLNYHEGHAGYRREGWRKKPWLLDAATAVATQTARYRGQLSRCRTN